MSLVFPRLYAIMSAPFSDSSGMAFSELLVDAGVKLIQIRAKSFTSRRFLELATRIADFCGRNAARVIVNDRPDVARLSGAGGVHLGQDDMPVDLARLVCGHGLWIGISTHSLVQVQRAEATAVDYVAVGPIFPTLTKESPEPVVGIDFIRAARRLTTKPLVAIGGITLARVREVLEAGADSVAVARDLFCAPDIKQRVQQYLLAVAG